MQACAPRYGRRFGRPMAWSRWCYRPRSQLMLWRDARGRSGGIAWVGGVHGNAYLTAAGTTLVQLGKKLC